MIAVDDALRAQGCHNVAKVRVWHLTLLVLAVWCSILCPAPKLFSRYRVFVSSLPLTVDLPYKKSNSAPLYRRA